MNHTATDVLTWDGGPFPVRYTLSLGSGAVVEEQLTDGRACEFPTVAPARLGRKQRYAYCGELAVAARDSNGVPISFGQCVPFCVLLIRAGIPGAMQRDARAGRMVHAWQLPCTALCPEER